MCLVGIRYSSHGVRSTIATTSSALSTIAKTIISPAPTILSLKERVRV